MAYKGTSIIIDKLLYQPKNSLVNQSINAKEIEVPLNGDGFGVGWYVPELNYEPITFVSTNPAGSNRNLRTRGSQNKNRLHDRTRARGKRRRCIGIKLPPVANVKLICSHTRLVAGDRPLRAAILH